ncbi:MAG: type II secretion system F family protein [Acetobacter fabarum]|jgi:tight adherence protein B|uniref:type II secretion system F family protein n=1 Tax=Acetobacter fabarum TaxID=483199 RepID=UPI00243234E8|nr:type II secretion system F family protein [Acetobacter fabarum]MCH4025512.1 type II secretion system F family protein [Acetobacter fabarum]MCH4055827.1 type II secretion system F family protein [Acetobacter fabarum]MCH4086628.1 type II secretion system F family protein [Acetobacter fabarum]MCH4128141.1 type II secretion system F family protein [Acetobacter fabarum]MCH4138502.1 type II secretion system F family protein [Acetobacter fabarum]
MTSFLLVIGFLFFAGINVLAYLLYQSSIAKDRRNKRIYKEISSYLLHNIEPRKRTPVEWAVYIVESGFIRKFLIWASKYNPQHYAHSDVGLLKIYLLSSIFPTITLYYLFSVIGIWSVIINFFIWVATIRFICNFLRNRYKKKLYTQFPDAIGMMVRSLRVGVPLSRCMIVVSEESDEPTCREFKVIAGEVAVGRSLGEVLQAVADRVDLQEYRFLATVISIQSSTGGALADVLSSLADTIKQQIAIYKRGLALSSEAKMSSYVLAALPFFIAILLEFVNPDYINQLFWTQSGHYLLASALFLFVLGMAVMKIIISRTLDL